MQITLSKYEYSLILKMYAEFPEIFPALPDSWKELQEYATQELGKRVRNVHATANELTVELESTVLADAVADFQDYE